MIDFAKYILGKFSDCTQDCCFYKSGLSSVVLRIVLWRIVFTPNWHVVGGDNGFKLDVQILQVQRVARRWYCKKPL